MNQSLSTLLVVAAAACGLALAQSPKPDDANALAKRVEALEAEVAALKKAKPSDVEGQLAKSREAMDALLVQMRQQTEAAEKLQAVLADSREKGFTYGINPDSRTVLLAGFHEFAESLKSDIAPAAAPIEQPKR